MKNVKIMTTAWFILLVFSWIACTEDNLSLQEQNQIDLENLTGTYMDESPYPYGEAFGQRIFTFENGHWTLKFTLGLDPKLENKVFEFRTLGSYKITGASTVVDNAYNAEFGEDKKFVTLKTDNPQLIEAFGFGTCGLTPNVEQDISIRGCSLWKPVAECPVDYDLVSLDTDGLLYFGQRPADNNMCSEDRRPKALTPPVTKQ